MLSSRGDKAVSDKGTSLQRLGVNLPGQPQGPGRPRNKTEEMTDLIDEMALEFGDQMAAMALQALQDGMRAKDLKHRLDAAKAYLNNFHHPSKQMDVNVTENVSISAETRDAADHLTAHERAIVEQFQQHIIAQRDEHVVDVEVVEEQAPELPPLPASGEGQA